MTAAASTDQDTAAFYAALKYPGPDAIITTVWAKRISPHLERPDFRFLDAGCGSGRHSAGVLLTHPESRGIGLDLSRPSLAAARALLAAKGIDQRIDLICASHSEPLPIGRPVDVALAIGTIHHAPDPARSLANIAATVRPGGIVAAMVYGQRGHRRRYEIREMLDLLCGIDGEAKRRLHAAYTKKYAGLLDTTPRQTIMGLRKRLSHWRHRIAGKGSDFGYLKPGAAGSDDVFFLDSFAAPIDRAFESGELRAMLDAAGLELVDMLTLGRPDPRLLPDGWHAAWRELDTWDKIRVSELLDPQPASFSFIARRR